MQKYDYVKNIMQNVWATEYDGALLKTKIFAQTAQWKDASSTADLTASGGFQTGWYLSDGIVYNYDPGGLRNGPARLFGAKGYFLHPQLTPEIMEKSAESANESLNELSSLIQQYPQQAAFRVKYYNKFSFPLANFVLVFIGVPLILSSPTRRNFFRGIGICIAVSLGFFLMKFSLEALSKKDIMPSFLASWLPLAVFAVVAVYLWRKLRM
jgi:lipopolysaccharide export LptBFGC system permease protein LptF